MLSQLVRTFDQHDVTIVVCMGKPYIRAGDVTAGLGYKNSSKAIKSHVNLKYIKTLQQLGEMTSGCTKTNIPNWNIHNNQAGRSPLYLNESGVHELVFKSDMPQAVRFREWIVEVVLPDIRQTGKYVMEQQVLLMNENDLHYKVIHFIRNYWNEAVIVAGLGELQDTSAKRIESWEKRVY